MNTNNLIKREFIIVIVSVIMILILLIGFSFSYFLVADEGENNIISIGDLNISFCEDETCNKGYENFGQVIGTKNINGKSVVEGIYPYISNSEALKSTPYIFNIKNTGSLKSILTIKLVEDKDYQKENYTSITDKFSDNIKIGLSDCTNTLDRENVFVDSYSKLEDNVILTDKILDKDESVTYCLWTWLDENTPNNIDNTYFVANLDFEVEYKPNH